MIQIFEIKAVCHDHGPIRSFLLENGARFVGTDHQKDTYFNVQSGRLKWREGNIESNLIHYFRANQKGPKLSDVTLQEVPKNSNLIEILTKSLGILTIIQKEREIYFIDNVKFHLDHVIGLGRFIEIEAIDEKRERNQKELKSQCEFYLNKFDIPDVDLIEKSYSDLLLSKS